MLEDRKFIKGLKKMNKEELAMLWAGYILTTEASKGEDELAAQRALAIRMRFEKIDEIEYYLDFVAEQAAKEIIRPGLALYEFVIQKLLEDKETTKGLVEMIEQGKMNRYIFIEVMPKMPDSVVDKITEKDIKTVIIALYTSVYINNRLS